MAKTAHGITLKKQYGQHFLRDPRVVEHMLQAISFDPQLSIFEIGCGDGFLTERIVAHEFARLWIFEIDPEWAAFVRTKLVDPRLEIFLDNILDVEFKRFEPYAPWVLLANLPYQITFPLLHLFVANRALLKEGVIMVQEEVAQKIMKTSGRGYGFPSLYFQHFFEWKALDKIPPTAFYPPPKVFSRLLYFKPRAQLIPIAQEAEFWKFIKACFKQPHRTLKNNLAQTHYDLSRIDAATLVLRAQQLAMADLLSIWQAFTESGR